MANESEMKAIANTFIRIAAELSDLADRLHRLADGKMEKMDSEQIFRQKHGTQGYHSVDLGIPSGLKWADRNVGAATPEAYGDYFMWGSVTPDTGKPCNWAHAPFNNASSSFDETYFNAHESEWLTEDGTLKPEYDAAHVNMGGNWRMPTTSEMRELIDGTTWSNETLGGIPGMRFTSKANGNSIFMPFSGYRDGYNVRLVGYYGNAWSSSLGAGDDCISRYFTFDGGGCIYVDYDIRYYGFVVRGVHE